jgi:TolB protein
MRVVGLGRVLFGVVCFCLVARAQTAPVTPPADESALGEFVVTGVVQEHIPKIAVLPSHSPAIEDVVVRSVVRRDLEISGFFEVIGDKDAPAGRYGFTDAVDVKVWQSLGAEAIVKVAAREATGGKIEVLGIAYFPSAGKEPVYETKLTVDKALVRRTAHKITDDLIGALTGRPGGFSSHFTFSGAWGRNRRIFSVDADGNGLAYHTNAKETSIAPAFGPGGDVFFTRSKNYSPYRPHRLTPVGEPEPTKLDLPFKKSIYGIAFDKGRKKMAVAVAETGGSAVYVGDADGKNFTKVSTTTIATHPAFSPSGKLAWVGGEPSAGAHRIYVDGKVVSPAGFSASAPTFCDTEDGVFLVYSVGVGGGRSDLIMSGEKGQGVQRLTQGQGSNTYPACSPDGRMLAFFSDRKEGKGLYVLSLKRFTTQRVIGSVGESLRWDPLPAPSPGK